MFTIFDLKQWAREKAPNLYRRYVEHHRASLPAKVGRVLANPRNPTTLSEAEFDELQSKLAPWWPDYGFDYRSCWQRGHQRAITFLDLPQLQTPGLQILEAACGDGMTAYALSSFGHRVTLLDYEDWRLDQAAHLPFIKANLGEKLDLASNRYDLIYSFNAFEHITHPDIALHSLKAHSRPGGLIYLSFDPLYASPLGLHAFSFHMPYPQFLFSENLIRKKLQEFGNPDLGKNSEALQPLNKWTISRFRRILLESDFEVLSYEEHQDHQHLHFIDKYPHAFRGRGLTLDDVTVTGIDILLRAPDGAITASEIAPASVNEQSE